MSTPSLLMEAAAEVARIAGDIACGYFRSTLDVQTKADGSPVTIADRAAETAARDWLAQRFPSDSIVGEEFGTDQKRSPRRWFIDPIDGTKSFVRGVPLWGTLVGVAEGDEIVAGAAYFPALAESLCAARGEGCWWNGARTYVSTVAKIEEATVLTTDEQFTFAPEHREGWQRLATGAAFSRSWGDCYGYLLVATGRAEVMVDGVLTDWDAAALMPAVIEAGGAFTDWDGKPTAFGGSAIATNSALAESARSILARVTS